MSRVTVGDLRQIIADLPDAMRVVIPDDGGEYDQTEATSVGVVVLDWLTDDEGDELEEPVPTQCLVLDR